jgi:hypothetical protein
MSEAAPRQEDQQRKRPRYGWFAHRAEENHESPKERKPETEDGTVLLRTRPDKRLEAVSTLVLAAQGGGGILPLIPLCKLGQALPANSSGARKSENHENTKGRKHEKESGFIVSCFRSFVFS